MQYALFVGKPPRKRNRFGKSFLIALGFIVLTGGIFMAVSLQNLLDRALPTEAVITRIEMAHNADGDNDYRVHVSYQVNGKSYTGVLNYYVSTMRVGGTTPIRYLPDDPGRIVSGDASFTGAIILCALGGLIMGVGLVWMLVSWRNNRKRSNLRRFGRCTTALITAIDVNTRIYVNGVHPFRITCTAEDGKTVFRSGRQLFGRDLFRTGDPISVYVDRNDRRRYDIDVINYLAERQKEVANSLVYSDNSGTYRKTEE